MKQVFFLTLLLFVNILGKDKMANLEYNKQKIYIIEIFQEEVPEKILKELSDRVGSDLRDLNKNYFFKVGIIKLGTRNKILETYVKEGNKADIEGEIYKEFNNLLEIDFSNCNLSYPVDENGNVVSGIPVLIKKLNTRVKKNGTIVYRGLAIIDKETYDEKPPYLKYPGLLKREIEKKQYICPEYYNGD